MAQDPPVRLQLRSFVELWLDVGAVCAAPHGGDPVSTYVFEVLASANAAHLPYAGPESARLAAPGPLEDKLALLRPVSGNAVAQSLGVPYETVRVRLLKMIADGQVRRVPGGLLAVANLEAEGPIAESRARAHEVILGALRGLKGLGYSFADLRDPRRLPGPTPPALTVRIVLGLLNRVAELQSPRYGGLLNMTIWCTVARANTRPLLRDRELAWRYATADSPPPNSMRQPISVRALAAELGMAFETTRRHVAAMTDRGWLSTVPGRGVIGPTAVVAGPGIGRVIAELPSLFVKALADLDRVGFDFEAL